jgi:hypothetical protein
MKNHYVVEVEEFIADNRHRNVAWPCVHRTAAYDSSRVRLLLCGDLVVDLPVRVAGRITPQFVSRWRNGEPPNCEWDFGRPSPGGFVGQAAPVAADLGCDVHIATVIPLPTPPLVRTFLESRSFDSRNVVACPGPVPVSVRFRFIDRRVAITYPGVSALATPRIPSNPGETFDIVLADAGWPEGRPERLESLVESCRRSHRELQLGIVGRGDLSAAELRLLSRKHCWLFLSEAAAREVARHFASDGIRPGLTETVAGLKRRLGPNVRLVVSSRDRGISLMNGASEPRLFATSRLADGARHVLNVYTLLSSMRGMTDEAAIRAGIDAAEDHVPNSIPGLM